MVASHELRAEGIRSQLGQTPDSLAEKFQASKASGKANLDLQQSDFGIWNLELSKVPISTASPKIFTFISCKAWTGMVESSLQGLLDVSRCGRSGSRQKAIHPLRNSPAFTL